ncbi:MAG: TlpA family protein disulfide reductase [Candidatus Omnitrophica bacterium]|nr:TlpA family protein disulfide reductase [Candidatus Omnitrophota bacterium]
MKNKILIVVIVIFGIIAAIFTVAKLRETFLEKPGVTKPVSLKRAPDFTLFDMEGRQKKLSDFEDKVIILDFWATWCPPCKAEIPHFIALYDEYKDEGLEIIGVVLDKDAENSIGYFAKEYGINYTILLGNRVVTDLYGGIVSIPTTFVIDRDGRIRKRYIGYRDKEVFKKDIKELL